MPKPRIRLFCPWCGARLKRMAAADRIKANLAPGSRIEKEVARCPSCSKIIRLKAPPHPVNRSQVKLWAAFVIALATAIGLVVLIYLMTKQ